MYTMHSFGHTSATNFKLKCKMFEPATITGWSTFCVNNENFCPLYSVANTPATLCMTQLLIIKKEPGHSYEPVKLWDN